MNLDSDSHISPLLTNQGKLNDRINEMPDDILSSILSLLSIKDATKARVLSRRWRYMCPSILDLSFDFHTLLGIKYDSEPDISPQDMCKFVTRVDQFLELYKGQTLDSLKVNFCLGDDEYASHIDGWIKSAIRMKTKRLDLDFSPNHNRNNFYDFRCHILLHAETYQLKHLHLKKCNLSLAPHLVCSPISLTKLDLESVRLDQNTAESILSGCLNIQWLSLQYCNLPETLCIHGPSLHLKTLIVFNCIDVNKIEISSVGLTSFEYTGRVIQFTFIDVCHLDKVHLGFLSAHVNVKQYLFYGLPKDLPQLQTLSLGLTTNEILSVPASISRFNYLKQLEVFIWITLDRDLLFLTSILNASPNLKKFHLAVLSRTALRDPRRREQPYCNLIHYQLKEVEVSGFNGHPDEVELVIYLLNNVLSLEQMTLNPKHRVYNTSIYKRRCDMPWVEEERKEAYDLLRKEKFNSRAKLILL